MTLRWIEGWEVDKTTGMILRKYTNVTTSTSQTFVAGRLHGTALRQGNTSTPIFRTPVLVAGSQNTWIWGMAINASNLTTTPTDFVRVMDGNNMQCRWRLIGNSDNNNYRIDFTVGSTTLATTSANFISAQWYYIEGKVLLATGATGTYELRTNEGSDATLGFSATGIVTANSAPSVIANAIEFNPRPGNGFIVMDDQYVCDGSGTIRNNFLGDCVVEGALPIADGPAVQFGISPSSPTTHFDKVDDPGTGATPIDDDTSYVVSTADGQKDYYQFTPLAFLQTAILGVQTQVHARLDTTGLRNYRHSYRNSGGTETESAIVPLTSTSYVPPSFIVWQQNPIAAADWTVVTINGGFFGVKTG